MEKLRRRLSERDGVLISSSENIEGAKLSMEHKPEFLPHVLGQFKLLKLNAFTIRTTPGNNCIQLTNGDIVQVKNIVKCVDGIRVVGNMLDIAEDLFVYPLSSRDENIQEYLISGVSQHLTSWHLDEIRTKIVLLPMGEKFAAIPLLHVE